MNGKHISSTLLHSKILISSLFTVTEEGWFAKKKKNFLGRSNGHHQALVLLTCRF